jgi:hypothetical protein
MIAGLVLALGLLLLTVEPGPGALAYNLTGLALVLLAALIQPTNRSTKL